MTHTIFSEAEKQIEYHYKKGFGFILHEEFFFNKEEFNSLMTNIRILKKQYHGSDCINRIVIGNLRMIEMELRWTYQECDKYNKRLDSIDNEKLFQYLTDLSMEIHNLLFDMME